MDCSYYLENNHYGLNQQANSQAYLPILPDEILEIIFKSLDNKISFSGADSFKSLFLNNYSVFKLLRLIDKKRVLLANEIFLKSACWKNWIMDANIKYALHFFPLFGEKITKLKIEPLTLAHKIIALCPNLTKLEIDWSGTGQFMNLESPLFQSVCSLKKLKSLKLSADLELWGVGPPYYQNMHYLSRLTVINKLNLRCPYTYYSVKDLKTLTNLEHLKFDTPEEINDLSNLTNLRSLNLGENCFNLRNFSPLSNLTQLEKFKIYNTEDLPGENIDFSFLKNFTNLKCLDIGGYTDEWGANIIENLRYKTSLETLKLWDISELACFYGLESLKDLYIRFSCKTGPVFSHLSMLTSLETLDLNSEEIQNLSFVTRMTHLKVLKLNIDLDCDLCPLTKLTKLSVINFGSKTREIKNIYQLKPLLNLREFKINNEHVEPTLYRNLPLKRAGDQQLESWHPRKRTQLNK